MSKNRFFGFSARFLMLMAAGLLVVSYLSVLVNPEKLWFLTLFGIFFVPIFALNLFLFAWSLVRRSKAVFIPLLALLPSLIFMGGFVQLSDNSRPAEEDSIKFISYNVGRFSPNRRKGLDTRPECLDSVAAYIARQDADIICLQEFYVPYPDKVSSVINSHFKGYTPVYYMYSSKKGMYGNVILSRLPVSDKGSVKFEGSSNLAVYADVKMRDEVVRIYNCHLESYNISLTALAKSLRGDYKAAMQETENKMKSSIARRPAQVNQVLADIENSPVESLVCGDLNDSPVSYTYYRLSSRRHDSFRSAGKGFGATYSMLWPLLRIDYVFYPRGMKASSHSSPKVHYSDHYPVIVQL